MTYVNNDGASYNIEEALNVVNKMEMGGMSGSSASSKPSCKISMLWNWYTIDSCFIARSWHVNTRGQFAGSCIGVFLLVLSAQWLHRVAREYDAAIARRKTLHLQKSEPSDSSIDNVEKEASITRSEVGSNDSQALMFFPENTAFSNLLQPILYTLSHNWFWDFRKGSSFSAAYPSFVEHLIRSLIFTIQWGQSYIIMLLFMYYNGYIIISCILGALFGRIIFNYEPITCTTRSDSENNDKKCCM